MDFSVWQGERKLLPLDNPGADYCLRCVAGQGRLRVMSQAYVCVMNPLDKVILQGSDVATLTAEQDMQLQLDIV